MKRAKFSLSNYKLLSCDMGELVPVGLTEVLPGDTVQHATSALVRCSPMLAPVMHPVHVRIHHWFVPHRLVWDDWEEFITGGSDGLDASVFPTIDYTGGYTPANEPLPDYLGIPPAICWIAPASPPVVVVSAGENTLATKAPTGAVVPNGIVTAGPFCSHGRAEVK